jgi:fatty-acyl-CoA synthase
MRGPSKVATARLGLVLVNLSPAYKAGELSHALALTGCSALVTQVGPTSGGPIHNTSGGGTTSTSNAEYSFLDVVRQVVPELDGTRAGDRIHAATFPELRHVIGVSSPSSVGNSSTSASSVVSFGELSSQTADHSALSASLATLQCHEPANIQFTSGTTGLPKGTTLSHRNVLNNGRQIGHRLGLTPSDAVCVPVPMFHCFGMVLGSLAALTHGAKVVFPAEAFDPLLTLRAVQAERCTALHGVPTMFLAELNHPCFAHFDLSTLRTGIMAGTLCPEDVMRWVVRDMHIGEITVCYGMTETSPVTFQTRREDGLLQRTTTVGMVHPHVEAKVVKTKSEEELDNDEDEVAADGNSGNSTGSSSSSLDPLPVGQTGELWTRGYTTMLGYWNQPEKTNEVVAAGGCVVEAPCKECVRTRRARFFCFAHPLLSSSPLLMPSSFGCPPPSPPNQDQSLCADHVVSE